MTRAKRIVPAVLVSLTLMVLVMPASAWAQAKSELAVDALQEHDELVERVIEFGIVRTGTDDERDEIRLNDGGSDGAADVAFGDRVRMFEQGVRGVAIAVVDHDIRGARAHMPRPQP